MRKRVSSVNLLEDELRKYSSSLWRKPSASRFKPRVGAELYQQRYRRVFADGGERDLNRL